MSSTLVIKPSNVSECRYCHGTDHIKGQFNKATRAYITMCPKLIAKAQRENNNSLLRRQAVRNSRIQRDAAISRGEFVEARNTRTQVRVKSPGRCLRKTAQRSRFAMLDSDSDSDSDSEDQVDVPQLVKKVRQRPLQGAWGAGAPKVLPSSPKDTALLSRKRANQATKANLRVTIEPMKKKSKKERWADMADSDSDDEDLFMC